MECSCAIVCKGIRIETGRNEEWGINAQIRQRSCCYVAISALLLTEAVGNGWLFSRGEDAENHENRKLIIRRSVIFGYYDTPR